MTYNGLEAVGLVAIKDVGKISFISNKTKKEKLYLNIANKFDFSLSGDSVKAKGNGKDMVSFDLPKTGEGTFDLELASMDILSFANGSELKESTVSFYNRDEFEITSINEQVTLKDTPVGDIQVYVIAEDGTKIKELTGLSATGKTVVTTGSKKGDKLAIVYFTSKEALNFTIKATKEISESCTMILRCKGKTKTEGAFVDMQLTFPQVSVSSENAFNLDAENVTAFTLKVDIMGDSLDDMVQVALVPDII